MIKREQQDRLRDVPQVQAKGKNDRLFYVLRRKRPIKITLFCKNVAFLSFFLLGWLGWLAGRQAYVWKKEGDGYAATKHPRAYIHRVHHTYIHTCTHVACDR